MTQEGRGKMLSPSFLPLFTDLRGRVQPVEKQVVGPVGGPREPKTEAKTLKSGLSWPRTGARKEREGVFQHAGLFSEVRLNGVLRSSLTPAAPFGPIFSRFGITDHDEALGCA